MLIKLILIIGIFLFVSSFLAILGFDSFESIILKMTGEDKDYLNYVGMAIADVNSDQLDLTPAQKFIHELKIAPYYTLIMGIFLIVMSWVYLLKQ